MAGLDANKDQPPLERRTTGRDRLRRKSLDEYVNKVSNEYLNQSCTEEGLRASVDSNKKGGTGAEASEGSNPLHGASAPTPSIPVFELAGGAPGGAPAASSTHMDTPSTHLNDNSQIQEEISNEGQNNTGDTSDEEEEAYYTDPENQDKVIESTVLQGSPSTISDGIKALPNILTGNLRSDPDPKFESTPKKNAHESESENINISTKGTSEVHEIITNMVEDLRNISVPKIIVNDSEEVGKDDNPKPDTSPKSTNDLEGADKSPPILSGYSHALSEDSDFIEELPEKLQKIQSEASLISSPNSKNVFIDKSYWEMIGSAAAKMEWNHETLTTRLNAKSLYKSNVIRDSKRLLMSQLGSSINASYTAISRPSQVKTEEHLAFVILLHETISSVDVSKKAVVKDKSQTNLRSFLKKPDGFRTKKTGF